MSDNLRIAKGVWLLKVSKEFSQMSLFNTFSIPGYNKFFLWLYFANFFLSLEHSGMIKLNMTLNVVCVWQTASVVFKFCSYHPCRSVKPLWPIRQGFFYSFSLLNVKYDWQMTLGTRAQSSVLCKTYSCVHTAHTQASFVFTETETQGVRETDTEKEHCLVTLCKKEEEKKHLKGEYAF